MREGRLSEAFGAGEKPPGTALGRLTEDGRAERETQAEAASQEPWHMPGFLWLHLSRLLGNKE